MLKLQGTNPLQINNPLSGTQLGQLIGNSMSVNVLEQLFIRIFISLNILHDHRVERWLTKRAYKDFLHTPTPKIQTPNPTLRSQPSPSLDKPKPRQNNGSKRKNNRDEEVSKSERPSVIDSFFAFDP